MENKENVCEEKTLKTEQGSCEEVKEGSAVLGKFKSVDALERAYSALQAEFTRRSQRLKELERAIKDGDKDNSQGEKSRQGVEKLRAVAAKKREEEKEFDRFVSSLENTPVEAEDDRLDENPVSAEEQVAKEDTLAKTEPLTGVVEEGEELENCEVLKGKLSERSLEPACADGTVETNPASVVASSPLSSDALYEAVKLDEKARLRIIGDYLSSLRRADAPLMTGVGGLTVAPQIKPKSISAAGLMALRFFKKEES